MFTVPSALEAEFSIEIDHRSNICDTPMEHPYRLSHIKFHSVIGRRRITIQPPPSGLVKFNM